MSNLDKDLAEMRRIGYGNDYGRYKLDHPNTKADAPKPAKSKTSARREFQKVCACCGKSFVATCSYKTYCSDTCYRKASQQHYRARKAGERVYTVAKCEICGADFTQKRVNQKYCSGPCHNEGNRRATRLWVQRQKEAKNGSSV